MTADDTYQWNCGLCEATGQAGVAGGFVWTMKHYATNHGVFGRVYQFIRSRYADTETTGVDQ